MSSDLIVIYRGNPMDAEMLKQVFEDNGIVASLKGELMGTLAPWQISAGGVNPVEIEILAKDKQKAMALLEEFNKA